MKKEYDFSTGVRGKFFRESIKLNIPIYLEPEIREFVENIATKRGLDVETTVNKLLKTNMQWVKEVI